MSEGHNPYAPPQAEVKDAPPSGQELAGRGMRFVAAFVDGLLQFAVAWVLSLVLPWSIFNPNPSAAQMVTNGAIGLIVFLLLQGYLLVQRGQSIAKMLFGLRIVRRDGSKVSAARILGLRYGTTFVIAVIPVLGAIYVLIDCLLIFRGSRQCLHDQIADTIVVRV